MAAPYTDALIRWFDRLDHAFEEAGARRLVSTGIIVVFVGALVVIEAGRHGWLGAWGDAVPRSHFYAVAAAFTMLLLVEVVALVFALAHSVANALGKQLEILSLILLRSSFKELTHFPEPIGWPPHDPMPLFHILADAGGALLVFVILGFYYRFQQHRPITFEAGDKERFIRAKKLVALGLLCTFFAIAVYEGVAFLLGWSMPAFFPTFYTVLIFADLLIVMVSLRYSSEYAVVFRNSAFSVTTVLILVALAAPPLYNAALGVTAALFALGLTLAYNAFALHPTSDPGHERGI